MVILVSLALLLAVAEGFIGRDPVSYGRRYAAKEHTDGTRIIRDYPRHTMEVVLSFGVTDELVRVAEVAIEDNYSGIKSRQGEETDEIGKIMEHFYGGAWSVAFFEDPFMFSYTLQRRSPSFAVFDVDGFGISISREGGTR